MPLQPKQQAPYYQNKPNVFTLTDTQIKNLPTTPITLVPAPGPGKFIRYIASTQILDVTAGIYTNLNTSSWNITLQGQNPVAPDFSGAYLEDNTNKWIFQDQAIYDSGQPLSPTELENLPLLLTSQNTGNLTGGNPNNTLKIILKFETITI